MPPICTPWTDFQSPSYSHISVFCFTSFCLLRTNKLFFHMLFHLGLPLLSLILLNLLFMLLQTVSSAPVDRNSEGEYLLLILIFMFLSPGFDVSILLMGVLGSVTLSILTAIISLFSGIFILAIRVLISPGKKFAVY